MMETEESIDEWYEAEKDKLFDAYHDSIKESQKTKKKPKITEEQYTKRLDDLRAAYEAKYNQYCNRIKGRHKREKQLAPLYAFASTVKDQWEKLVSLYR